MGIIVIPQGRFNGAVLKAETHLPEEVGPHNCRKLSNQAAGETESQAGVAPCPR